MKVLLCCLYYTHFFVAVNLDFPINDQIKSLFRAQNLNPQSTLLKSGLGLRGDSRCTCFSSVTSQTLHANSSINVKGA